MRRRPIDVGDGDDGTPDPLSSEVPFHSERKTTLLSDGPSLEEWQVHCGLYDTNRSQPFPEHMRQA